MKRILYYARVGIAPEVFPTKCLILQIQDCNANVSSARCRMQEFIKGIGSQIRDCSRTLVPPESGWQHDNNSFFRNQDCHRDVFGQVQDAGLQQRVHFPQSGSQQSFVRFAMEYLFFQSQDCNKGFFGQLQDAVKDSFRKYFATPVSRFQWEHPSFPRQDYNSKILWPDAGLQ